jgi:hypothetical protein
MRHGSIRRTHREALCRVTGRMSLALHAPGTGLARKRPDTSKAVGASPLDKTLRGRHARRKASPAMSPAASSASATGVAEVAGHAEAAAVNAAPKVIWVKP